MIRELQEVLDRDIPLTRSIGIRVVSFDENRLEVEAPLEPNRNHKGTAFGGSLYSVAVTAGWGLVYLILRRAGLDGHIVIQDNSTRFLLPVPGPLSASAVAAEPSELPSFLGRYRRQGRARLDVRVAISLEDGRSAMEFSGRYVVHREVPNPRTDA